LNENSLVYKRAIAKHLKGTFPEDEVIDWNKHVEDSYKESLSRILLRIQNYQHGGAILISTNIGSDLKVKHAINYDRLFNAIIDNSISTISNYYFNQEIHDKYLESSKKNMPTALYLDESISDYDKIDTTDEIKGVLRFISSLSCVDGLILFKPELIVQGFGVVIELRDFPKYVYCSNTSKINESKLDPIESNHFGTRHRSMFSYCWNNPDSLGFVISQDGDIRAIKRFNDKLIMWENIKVLKYLRSHKLVRKVLIKRKKNGS
jgi:hypothetical protein